MIASAFLYLPQTFLAWCRTIATLVVSVPIGQSPEFTVFTINYRNRLFINK